MAEDSDGGGGGGGLLAIYDYDELRAAVLADAPGDLNALVLTWERMAGVLKNIGGDLSPIINAIGDAVATQHVGPALVGRLVGLASRVHNLTVDLHTNASALNQADLALRAAQKEIARLDGDGTRKLVDLRTGKDQRAPEAARAAYALNDAYADAITLMVIPGERDRTIGASPRVPGNGPTGSPAAGSGPAPTTSGTAQPVRTRGGDSGVGRGQPVTSRPDGKAPGRGSEGGHKAGPPAGAGGRRVAIPGARGGGPIGGSRIPVTRGGLLDTPAGATRSAGNAGATGSQWPSTPPAGARPDHLPPGGTPSRGGAGDERRRRRLSWYERIEDEFVDERSANSVGGVIPRAPERPIAADPDSALIGAQREGSEASSQEWRVPAAEAVPQGFPDTLENGAFSQPDGTRFQVRRRGSSA